MESAHLKGRWRDRLTIRFPVGSRQGGTNPNGQCFIFAGTIISLIVKIQRKLSSLFLSENSRLSLLDCWVQSVNSAVEFSSVRRSSMPAPTGRTGPAMATMVLMATATMVVFIMTTTVMVAGKPLLGVDVSKPTSQEVFQCLHSRGYSFGAVRVR